MERGRSETLALEQLHMSLLAAPLRGGAGWDAEEEERRRRRRRQEQAA